MPDNNPRIKAVRSGKQPYSLEVTWTNGRRTPVDMTGVVSRSEHFGALRDAEAFAAVRVVTHGWGIGWDCGLDYSAESLDRLAREQEPMTGDDFIAWQRNLELSNQEAADVLGVTLTTIKNYRRLKSHLPTMVTIACSSLAEDRTAFFAHFRPRRAGRPRRAAAGERHPPGR
ncbi:MAG: DUF2442 domain-containing protein [Rhodospirillales bacterium]